MHTECAKYYFLFHRLFFHIYVALYTFLRVTDLTKKIFWVYNSPMLHITMLSSSLLRVPNTLLILKLQYLLPYFIWYYIPTQYNNMYN